MNEEKNSNKSKGKFYTKWWFWVIVGFVAIALAAPKNTSDQNSARKENEKTEAVASVEETAPAPEPEKTYTHYTAVDLFDELDANALKAEQTHQNEYVEVEGYLRTIDSDGKYICIGAGEKDYSYLLDSIQCYIKSDEQRQIITELSKYDLVVVRGKIKSIGEVLGYSLDMESIEKIG